MPDVLHISSEEMFEIHLIRAARELGISTDEFRTRWRTGELDEKFDDLDYPEVTSFLIYTGLVASHASRGS